MPESKESLDRKSQESAAESLRKQIEDLTSEKKDQAKRPGNLRDFINRKMAEDEMKE